jgi:hypothetical protein
VVPFDGATVVPPTINGQSTRPGALSVLAGAAVFAWHLFLQRLAHRRRQDHQQTKQDTTPPEGTGQPDPTPPDPLAAVRALLAHETSASRVTASHVQQMTGLSRSRAYAILRQLRDQTASPNGQPALSGLETPTRPGKD